MIQRCFDAAIPNHFAAHPDIAPHVGGPIDFTQAMRETAAYFFGEHGGLIFEWCAPGTYEVHIMLTREGRGAWGIQATQEALEQLNADRVWARIDPTNRPLAVHAIKSGFREVERRNLYPAGQPVPYRIFEWRKVCHPQ